MPFELHTERLIIRSWRAEDAAPFAALNADPQVMAFFPKTLSRKESDDWIAMANAHEKEHGMTFWALERKEDHALIGMTGLACMTIEGFDRTDVEVGWRLAFEHWGQGFVTEAAKACMKWGFEQKGLPEIIAMTVPANQRSRAVMERLSMTHNASDDFDHPKLPDGHPLQRHVLYRLKRKEWEKNAV